MSQTINEQLNIPIFPDGVKTYQPDLLGGAGMDEFQEGGYRANIVKGTTYFNRADGKKDKWGNCCGNFTGEEKYNYAVGNIEFCVGKCQALYINKDKEAKCIQECKDKYNIHTIADLMGSTLSPSDAQRLRDNLPSALGGNKPRQDSSNGGVKKDDLLGSGADQSLKSNGKKYSTGAIIGIGVGVLVLAGLGIYLYKRSKSKK